MAETQPFWPAQTTGYQPFWTGPRTGTVDPAASRVMIVAVVDGWARQLRVAPPVLTTFPVMPVGVAVAVTVGDVVLVGDGVVVGVGVGVVPPVTWR